MQRGFDIWMRTTSSLNCYWIRDRVKEEARHDLGLEWKKGTIGAFGCLGMCCYKAFGIYIILFDQSVKINV
jgi:hypothetical protein